MTIMLIVSLRRTVTGGGFFIVIKVDELDSPLFCRLLGGDGTLVGDQRRLKADIDVLSIRCKGPSYYCLAGCG